jgi:hypothetical protein
MLSSVSEEVALVVFVDDSNFIPSSVLMASIDIFPNCFKPLLCEAPPPSFHAPLAPLESLAGDLLGGAIVVIVSCPVTEHVSFVLICGWIHVHQATRALT